MKPGDLIKIISRFDKNFVKIGFCLKNYEDDYYMNDYVEVLDMNGRINQYPVEGFSMYTILGSGVEQLKKIP